MILVIVLAWFLSASRYVMSASRYQSRSSMSIRGLIPQNPTVLTEVVPIPRSGFPTRQGSNQPAQLRRPDRKVEFCMKQVSMSLMFCRKRMTKADQTARMRRLVCGICGSNATKPGFVYLP